MRNNQLIRQWKILRYIANGHLDPVSLELPELSERFNKSYKTIRRDLQGLVDAGFLISFAFKSPKKKRVLRPNPRLTTELRGIEKSAQPNVASANLLQCNSCPYLFKTVDGRLDMKDFRKHKALHR